ncbi:cation diffusion facilitator family transporter [Bacillus sp. V59.32b]|uniref:cation diffusion facilitator family transporter n=1 Tax=Bacillus sp. V59.32b TaxID=1758642 RepID=UPI000E3C00CF|nr:cation diffusion facilitator family transporter [Bacillus sp. V59.32b]RFU62691.1 cation transporter [Bacillus sp. V59.32b]
MHDHQNSLSKRIGTAFWLNFFFAIVELIGGIITGSISIISDAVHDLGDSISLGASWYLEKKSHKKASSRFPFGYKRFSLLSALISGSVLIFGSLFVLIEAGKRLFDPVAPNSQGMLYLAILGVIVNGFAAIKLKKGDGNLNSKVLSWHLLEDVMGWAAILIVSIIMMFKEIPILDPILSICITLFVLFNVVKSLKSTLTIFLESTPNDVDVGKVEKKIRAVEGVKEVKQLRIWTIDGEHHALTVHLKVGQEVNPSSITSIKQNITAIAKEINIIDQTIQIDY